MIGCKYTGGERRPELSVVVLVNRKRARGKLGAGERIPAWLTAGDKRIKTDVRVMRGLRRQSWRAPVRCADDYMEGVASLFWRTSQGLFALSCAHVLRGDDLDANLPSHVWMWRGDDYLKAGRTLRAFDTTGSGSVDDFGFDDVASFAVTEPWAQAEAASLRSIAVRDVPEQEVGLEAMGKHGLFTGDVIGKSVEYEGWYCDYVLNVGYPGSRVGDSGMLWRTQDGHAVAIHALGGEDFRDAGSSVSAAMSVSRVMRKFGIRYSQLRAAPL